VQQDLQEAVQWYNSQQEGLGTGFLDEVLRVLDSLVQNPLLGCRHIHKNIRWRYPERFPYRVIYENTVVVAAVLHAARHDRHWRKRL